MHSIQNTKRMWVTLANCPTTKTQKILFASINIISTSYFWPKAWQMNLRVIQMFSIFIIFLSQTHVFPFQHKDTTDFEGLSKSISNIALIIVFLLPFCHLGLFYPSFLQNLNYSYDCFLVLMKVFLLPIPDFRILPKN